MSTPVTETYSETIPLKNEARSSTSASIEQAGRTFGTKYFLISAVIASIIPIIKLALGIAYKNQCPIDERIPTYMIVAGAFGLALAALAILLSVTFLCFLSNSAVLTVIGGCGVLLNVFVTFLISFFLFIWFILGCVWVFGVRHQVQYNNPLRADYCHPVLYKGTEALLILTIIWCVIQCCLSCFRQSSANKTN